MQPSNRVTLDVRNMEVREVVRKIQRQTGRTIVVEPKVTGKVTLKAKNLPFNQALEIVAEQASARVASIYPLYSNGKSLEKLKAILTGASESRAGWTNLAASGMRFGGPGPRRDEPPKEQTISLNISFENLAFTALAFSRLASTRMVIEDGATNRISVSFTNAPIREAVALVAKKAGKNWAQIYTLSGGEFGRGRPGFARGPRSQGDGRELSEEEKAERDVLNEELLATLPEEERQKREEAAAERQKQMAELQSMTPEQRMQAMQAMRQNQPQGGAQRMLERIKNSTPEQRAAQRRQMAQMRARNAGNGVPPVTRN
jgi:type II secretory pathway component HofQ